MAWAVEGICTAKSYEGLRVEGRLSPGCVQSKEYWRAKSDERRAKRKCGLVGDEGDAYRDAGCGEPAAVVDLFVEEELCCDGVADVGQRGDGGGGEGEVGDAEGGEHGEEVECHAERAKDEAGCGEDGADSSGEAAVGADVIEVAQLAHTSGDEDFAGDGKRGDEDDGCPDVEGGGVHVSGPSRSRAG